MKISREKDWTKQLIYLFIFLYVLALSILSIMRYSSYHAAIYDLGIMVQAIWNTAHGRLFYESVNMGYPISRFWTAHWEFIYLLIAPFYAIFQSPKFLLILQSLLIGIGALPIYLIGRKILKNKALAGAIALSYLLNPAVQNSNLFDFHGTTLATSLILFGFYFFIEKKWKLFWGVFILALLCREDVSLIWLFFGLYVILFSTHKKLGLSLSFIGALWFILFMNRLYLRNFLGLLPIQWTVDLPSHWSNLSGGGIKDLLISIITRPMYVLQYVFSGQNLVYYVKLFFPVLFLSFAAPEILLIAFPIFFINVMSNYSFTHDIKSQYTALLTPFIYISMIYGLNRILTFIQRKLTTRLRFIHHLVLIGIVGAAGISFFLQSQAFQATHWLKTDHDRMLDKMLQKIPDEASVSTTNLIGAHVANRYKLYAFPNRYKEADYVVYDFYAPFEYLYSDTSFQMPIVPPNHQMSKKLLNDNNIKGVIITQGTDFLHYASAALSFFLRDLNKPVILTYSQRSIDRASSDAELNLQCSSLAAISDIAEVMVVGHATINDDFCYAIPGTKIRKIHSSRRDAFKVVNGKPFAKIFPDKIEIISPYRKRNNKGKVKVDSKFEEKVALVKIYPGQEPEILDYYLKRKRSEERRVGKECRSRWSPNH